MIYLQYTISSPKSTPDNHNHTCSTTSNHFFGTEPKPEVIENNTQEKWATLFNQNKLTQVIVPKEEQYPDNVDVYSGINWSKTAVGGSTALKFYTKDDNINPSDLDLLIKCSSKEEFDEEALSFEKKSGATRLRDVWYPENLEERERFIAERDPNLNKQEEMFHQRIKGSATFKSNNIDKIQLVCFGNRFGESIENTTVEDMVKDIVDLPACVNYKVLPNGDKIFTMPSFFPQMAMKRVVPVNLICKTRREKYEQRGWKFVSSEEMMNHYE
jgi:hypothetical protein